MARPLTVPLQGERDRKEHLKSCERYLLHDGRRGAGGRRRLLGGVAILNLIADPIALSIPLLSMSFNGARRLLWPGAPVADWTEIVL